MNKWTDKWPTKPGTYWFHGFTSNRGGNPVLLFTRVSISVADRVVVLAEGRLLSPAYGARGQFRRVELPKPPEIVEGIGEV
jgi:hypothetical protein